MKALNFLSSDPGTPSSMRVMSFCSLLFGAGIAVYGLYKGIDPEKLAWLVAVFVTSAFGGKVLQKRYEVKDASSQDPTAVKRESKPANK